MNLYLISQSTVGGYDIYDTAVVAAETIEQAANTHPNGLTLNEGKFYGTWANSPDKVDVKLIGVAMFTVV